ncbi:MAG: class I SAM-dependent methyltransferase [Desulfocapsaceae bacterium]|nr:class I SAM-dependent methyltransferase [Desulfocapsaceae bacterium]
MTLTVLNPLDARIPKWNYACLAVRHCPFCGAQNETVLIRPDLLPVAFCETCGCWYINNLPSSADIMSLYDGYYHTHRPADLSKKGFSQMVESARKSSESNVQLHSLLKLHAGNGRMRILDVGCGFGRFLLEAKSRGAEVEGCDLSPEACEFANNKLGITVHQSKLHLCASSIDKVDAVVMSDFLEHPVEPLIDIQAAVGILKPGGLLLFHTPNGGEAGTNIETARNWVGFRVDLEHFQYLSPHTVNWLSHKYDLRIERLETSGFPSLKGIDKLPRKSLKHYLSLRERAKRIPKLCGMVKTLRVLKTEMLGGSCDLRLGSYHLFAILRKVR